MQTLLITLALSPLLLAENLPLLLKEDFSKGAERWQPTDPKMWKLTEVGGNQVYELLGISDYKPPFRSPFSFALLKDHLVGSFELTARIQTTQKTTGHRDLCFIFNYQDPSHFYYLHLGEKPDEHSSQFFIVNEAPRTAISKSENGVPWKDGEFHTLKIVRDAESGRIDAYFDDMETPLKSAVDKTFTWGQIGIGSFDDMGYFDDLELRAVQIKKGPAEGKRP
jgi:hypothetical protein